MAIKGGTIITKVALDDKGLKTSLDGVKRKGKRTATDIEKAWKSMGKKSDQTYDQMKAHIEKNYNTIKNHAKSTAADIVRAEKAKAQKIARINKQQFGEQHKYLNKLKQNWKSYALVAIAAVTAVAYAAKRTFETFLDAAKTSENLRVRLEVLLGSVKEGNRLFEEMSDYASRVPFEFEQIMASATMLAGVMKGGVGEIKTWMPMIGDLAAASGLSIEKTTEQVMRMYAAGAASADLFRERGVLAMLGFQAGVSYSAEETRTQLIRAWEDVDSKFRGATNKLAKTWSGLMSMLSDKWFQFRNLVMEAGVFDEVKNQLTRFNEYAAEWLKTNQEIIKQSIPEYIEGMKDWFTNLRINIITVQAEIMRLAMLLDKLGGSWTSAKMLLYGPGAALGVESSKERFEAAAEANMEYERRYKETSKALESLALKQIHLEETLTSTYKKRKSLITGEPTGVPTPTRPIKAIGGFDTSWQRFEGSFKLSKGAQALIDADKKLYEDRAKLREEFNAQYADLGKNQFELEREKINEQAEAWRLAGANKVQVAQLTSDKIKAIDEAENQAKLSMYASSAGMIADTFQKIAQAGGKQSEKAFRVYQAFSIAEAIISANLAAAKVLGQTGIFGIPLSALIYGQAMMNVAMIAATKPPSYDEGGISRAKGVYQTGNIDEAHIPLKSGKVPVSGASGTSIVIKMENPVFQDVATQRQVFAQIAEIIATRVAPGAVVQNYQDDGPVRQMIRRGA